MLKTSPATEATLPQLLARKSSRDRKADYYMKPLVFPYMP